MKNRDAEAYKASVDTWLELLNRVSQQNSGNDECSYAPSRDQAETKAYEFCVETWLYLNQVRQENPSNNSDAK